MARGEKGEGDILKQLYFLPDINICKTKVDRRWKTETVKQYCYSIYQFDIWSLIY